MQPWQAPPPHTNAPESNAEGGAGGPTAAVRAAEEVVGSKLGSSSEGGGCGEQEGRVRGERWAAAKGAGGRTAEGGEWQSRRCPLTAVGRKQLCIHLLMHR